MNRIVTFFLTFAMLIPCVSCSAPSTADSAAGSTALTDDVKPVVDDSEQVNAILLAAQSKKQEILSSATSIVKAILISNEKPIRVKPTMYQIMETTKMTA